MSMEGNMQEYLDVQKAPLWCYLSNAAKNTFSSDEITLLLKAQEEWAEKNFEAKEMWEKEKKMQMAINWTERFCKLKLENLLENAIESCRVCVRERKTSPYEVSYTFKERIPEFAISLLQKRLENELKKRTPSYMDFWVSVIDTSVRLENRLPAYRFKIEIKFMF